MRTSGRAGGSHSIPWIDKNEGPFWDWLRRIRCSWASLRGRSRGKPHLRDKWGCPYWLWIDENDAISFSRWYITTTRNSPVAQVDLCWDNKELILADIVIFELRDRKKGIGSILLESVIRLAKERSMEKIVGEIVPDHEEDREQLYRWYRSHGFTITLQHNKRGELTPHLEMDLQQLSGSGSTIIQ